MRLPGAPLGRLAALALAAALSTSAHPARADAELRKPWYVPDHSKLQLAGWIGFVSPGAGYSWFDRRLEADLFLGWVPPPLGGEHIVSLTSKLTFLPLRLGVGEGVTVQPLALSFQMTYTLGREYWIREPSRYPSENYYPLPSALRGGVGVGGDVGRALGKLERVSLYYELVALDVMLGFWIGNTRALGPSDAFSLALGLRFEH
jgi:hypothetical protein